MHALGKASLMRNCRINACARRGTKRGEYEQRLVAAEEEKRRVEAERRRREWEEEGRSTDDSKSTTAFLFLSLSLDFC